MTFIKGWREVALACCVVSGITLAESVPLAMVASANTEKQTRMQRVQPAFKPHSNLHVVQNGIRAETKPVPRHSARADHKNRKKQHRATLNRKGTNPHGRGTLPSGAGKEIRSLAYHGILEPPQRYEPGRERRKNNGAVPNPEARELQVDHFQELDRNQDGVLDPLERAVGRLDIERDINSR